METDPNITPEGTPEVKPVTLESLAVKGDRVAKILLETPRDAEPISIGHIRQMANDPSVSDDALFIKIVQMLAE